MSQVSPPMQSQSVVQSTMGAGGVSQTPDWQVCPAGHWQFSTQTSTQLPLTQPWPMVQSAAVRHWPGKRAEQ